MRPPQPAGTQTLNAISPAFAGRDAARTERHLRQCEELAELGIAIARAAAQRALQDLAGDTPQNPAEPASRKPDAALVFTHISRAIRLAIALEARIEAGPAAPARNRAGSADRPAPDTRRAPLQRALRLVTEPYPDRAALRRDAEERLDYELQADPHHEATIPDLLFAICEDLAIEIDIARLPDELLPNDPENPGIEPKPIRTPPLRI